MYGTWNRASCDRKDRWVPAKGVADVSPRERDSAISTVGQAVGAVAMSEDQWTLYRLSHFCTLHSILVSCV